MDPLSLFLSIGLNKMTAENALLNRKVTASLTAVIKEAGVDGCSKTIENLLYMVATKYPANALIHRPTLVQYIVSSKLFIIQIKNQAQIDAALASLSTIEPETFKLNEFEEACGVGVDISIEEIESSVNTIVEEKMNPILEQRYRINRVDISIEEIESSVNAVVEEKMNPILEQRYRINGVDISIEEIESSVNVVVEEKMNPILEQCYRINGVDISIEEIESSVNAVVEEKMNPILEQRYRVDISIEEIESSVNAVVEEKMNPILEQRYRINEVDISIEEIESSVNTVVEENMNPILE